MKGIDDSNNIELENLDDGNYEDILKENGLIYEADDTHFFVGNEPSPDDKIVFISVIISQIPSLLKVLIPLLISEGLTFQTVKIRNSANIVLHGYAGDNNTGKVIIISIPPFHNFLNITRRIINLTLSFKGPVIPKLVHLGGQLYAVPAHIKNNKNAVLNRRRARTIKNKYFILSVLNSHFKGDVLKAVYISGLLKFDKCVIKEGKRFMWSDNGGRDMKDRLLWQQKVQNDLFGIINIPKIIEFFEHHGNSYLVMTFIDGITLEEKINIIYSRTNWTNLSPNKQLAILDLLLEVIDIVEKIHQNGYIHRDLTDINFLITSEEKLYLIDWELAYGIHTEYPLPAFELGTAGFISPEQKRSEKPTIKEDIYALGALMILCFTHMPPIKFDPQSLDQMKKGIITLTMSEQIGDLIIRCISESPYLRPTLSEITNQLLSLKDIINSCLDSKIEKIISIIPPKLELENLLFQL